MTSVGARLNFNEIPIIHWKGKTFPQISAGIKFNTDNNNMYHGTGFVAPESNQGVKTTAYVSVYNTMKALPLKLYRREIASRVLSCNPRTSLRIDDFNAPGGTIISSLPQTNRTGLVNTEDFNYELNTCQHPPVPLSSDTTCTDFLSPEVNAKRRVRSSGNYKKRTNPIPTNANYYKIANNDYYFTDTNQYLKNRNRSYESNLYFHVRQGDVTVKPGTNQALQNFYQSNGINYCPKFNFPTATSFSYIWINGNSNTVNVPAGDYDIVSFNSLLQNTMLSNLHYIITITNNTRNTLLKLAYDSGSNTIQINSLIANTTIFPSSTYSVPGGATWSLDASYNNPELVIPNGIITTALGFVAGSYPTFYTQGSSNAYPTNIITFTSSKAPGLTPPYVPLYYKPNNPQFGTQGAVTSGDYITRLKYDNITSIASSFRYAYGNQTADAFAYGVSDTVFTIKDKYGFPNNKIPTIPKYATSFSSCDITTINGLRQPAR
jgi:hypothetical protein